MNDVVPYRMHASHCEILLPDANSVAAAAAVPALTTAGAAALATAQALARKATAPATLRAYKADWTHFADWCQSACKRDPFRYRFRIADDVSWFG